APTVRVGAGDRASPRRRPPHAPAPVATDRRRGARLRARGRSRRDPAAQPGRARRRSRQELPGRGGAGCDRVRLRRPRHADEETADVVANLTLLEPLADAIELNVSCPNVSWGRDRDNEEHLRTLLSELRPRATKPMFVKLPPFRSNPEREAVLAVAAIAQE